jgi:hypothetical protein
MRKFPSHLESSLIDKGYEPPKSYKSVPFAWELLELLDKHFRKDVRRRLQRSPGYFGIMPDETTDTSIDQQLIMYIKFLDRVDDKLIPTVSYLSLSSPKSGSAEHIKVSHRNVQSIN